jgi:magnesium chelatase accessory protein
MTGSVQVAPALRQRFVKADGLHWRLAEMGAGDTILLVHGTAASIHSWRDVMPLLAATHHVVALDLPGHGGTLSTDGDYSLARMGRGVAAVSKAMDLKPRVVAGHSAGAAILAWALARGMLSADHYISLNGAFYPFGGVAGSLFSPIAKLVAMNPFLPRILSGVASRHRVEKLLRDTGSNIGDQGVSLYLDLFKDPAHIASALGMMAAWELRDMEKDLARIEAQCLFVTGGRDLAVPPDTAQKAASCCRMAKVERVAQYGHLLHEENPALAAGIITGVLT